MSIKLPDFRNSRCQMLTACGEITGAKEPRVADLLKKKALIAVYKAAGDKAFVRVLGGRTSANHLHIDVAKAGIFRGKDPKATHKKSDLDRILKQVIGNTIDVGVEGEFLMPLGVLPADGVVRSLSVEKKSGNVALRMTAGTLSVEGAPVQSVEWEIRDGGKNVQISLLAERKSVVIDDNYLVDLLKWIESMLAVFVLGKENHAPDQESN
jgi:hypothetical protein